MLIIENKPGIINILENKLSGEDFKEILFINNSQNNNPFEEFKYPIYYKVSTIESLLQICCSIIIDIMSSDIENYKKYKIIVFYLNSYDKQDVECIKFVELILKTVGNLKECIAIV